MSAAIGASAAGARTYTATASQGLLYMAEALFNASGLGLPIVMTVANRAIGAPINIWNDHSDSMSQRDCGWIQLYAEDNQEAVDLHVLAFRLAEQLSVPVMVCVDGFVLTHAFEPIDVPDAGAGRRVPAAVRAAAGPRPGRAGHDRRDGRAGGVHRGALPRRTASCCRRSSGLAELAARVRGARSAGDSLRRCRRYRTEDAHARSSSRSARCSAPSRTRSTSCATGRPVGVLALTLYRPFPAEALRAALAGADRVIVLERAFAPGAGGIVSADVRAALAGTPPRVSTVVAGLGGRAGHQGARCARHAARRRGRPARPT